MWGRSENQFDWLKKGRINKKNDFVKTFLQKSSPSMKT